MNGDVQKAAEERAATVREIARQREVYAQPFANLIADGRRRCEAVDWALDEIAVAGRGRIEDRARRHFADALRLANKAARRRLDRTEDTFERLPQAAYDNARARMKNFAQHIESQVEALRRPQHEALDVFAQPFSRMAKSFLGDVELLFFGWALDGYWLHDDDVSSAQEPDSEGALNLELEIGEDFQFLRFWYPSLRQGDLFQHAVFGHELGHAALRGVPSSAVLDALGVVSDTPSFANVATDAADQKHEQKGASPFDPDDRQQLARWFVELACDMIGTQLLGPAFVLAFVEVTSVNHDLDRGEHPDSKGYPPTKMRREFLGRCLESFDFGRLKPQLDRRLDDALASMLPHDEPDREIPGATAWMTDAVDAFATYCLPELLGEERLDCAALRADLAEMWALLDAEIPPAEKIVVTRQDLPANGTPPWSTEYNWRTILNGVRLWLLARLAEHPELDALEERATALRLATGAIEMAEFHRRARVLSTQFDGMRLSERWR